MTVLLGTVCGALLAWFCTWAYMDHLQDQRWNREHGIVDDPADDLIQKAVTGELFERPDEHEVVLKIRWTGDFEDGLEVIEFGVDSLMTYLLTRTEVVDPSIERTSTARRTRDGRA